jgi:SAM-dependent methyltransferase
MAAGRMDAVEWLRLRAVLPHIEGELLDVGCGYNNLVHRYGRGVGVDVYPWPGVDVRIGDAARLPFADASFDTVAIVAALNHIPNRAEALSEARRVLRPSGRLVVTMIGPVVGRLAHVLFRHDEDVRGGFQPGEEEGLTRPHLLRLVAHAGFRVAGEHPFELGLNRVFVCEVA